MLLGSKLCGHLKMGENMRTYQLVRQTLKMLLTPLFLVTTFTPLVSAADRLPVKQLTDAEGYMVTVGGNLEFYYTKEFPSPKESHATSSKPASAFWVNRYVEDARDIPSVDDLIV